MKITVKVPISPYLGYGNDGIGILSELIEYGADTYITPGTLIDSPIPPQVAQLLTKAKAEKYDITIHHLDPDSFNPEPGEKTVSGLMVGWTMWEFSNLANSAGYDTLRKRLKDFDLFLAYDQNTAEALAEVFDGPIRVLQGGFMPDNWPKLERDWFDPDHFRFCMVGQLHDRKDPWLAIQAFSELKDEEPDFAGAELHLKNSQVGAFFPQMNELYAPKKIRIYDEIWDHDTMLAFYQQMHVLLAPSRGEGKNMPALEFQSTGGTVIATNWGGMTQWLNPAYNYPLQYSLHPIDDVYEHARPGNTLNARADKDDLKRLMLETYRNRAEVKAKSDLAADVVPQMFSWENVIKRMFTILEEFDPKIAHLAAVARLEGGDDE